MTLSIIEVEMGLQQSCKFGIVLNLIGIGPTSYINFVEGVGLIVLCKVWTENDLLPFGTITEQFTDLDFGSILNPSYLAWTNVSCIHSDQREAFGFLFGERKTQL
jgi:hypothetical protein